MYLLLIIYSITNLNVVSWGTREVAVKKTKKEMEEERKAAAANLKSAKKTGGAAGLWAFLQRQQEEVSSTYILCCTNKGSPRLCELQLHFRLRIPRRMSTEHHKKAFPI